jgi:hypothetical protein
MEHRRDFDRASSKTGDEFSTIRARYLVGAGVVHTGEYMAMLVTTYLVFHKTHSVAATGLILLCFNVPSLVLAGSATRISRRYGAARVDAWANLTEGVWALFPMALAATHHLGVIALLGWVLGYGVCEGLNAPSSYLVRQLIAEPGKLPELNSAYTRNVAAAAVVGLLLGGGILVAVGPAWVFLICALTAIPEILVFFSTSRHEVASHVEASSESFGDALRLLRSEPGLWAACRFAVLCFFVASYTVTLPAIANTISSNAEVLSVLESGSLIGGILVAFVVRRIHGRVRWGKVQRLCYFAAGLGLAAMASAEVLGGTHSRSTDIVAFIATIPIGFAVLMNASIVTSVIQIGTPTDKRASMFTLLALIPLLIGPLSQESVGLLADHLSISWALGIVAAVTVITNFVVSHRPMSRHFDTLDNFEDPFDVNEMLSQRGARRSRLHVVHWPDPI